MWNVLGPEKVIHSLEVFYTLILVPAGVGLDNTTARNLNRTRFSANDLKLHINNLETNQTFITL